MGFVSKWEDVQGRAASSLWIPKKNPKHVSLPFVLVFPLCLFARAFLSARHSLVCGLGWFGEWNSWLVNPYTGIELQSSWREADTGPGGELECGHGRGPGSSEAGPRGKDFGRGLGVCEEGLGGHQVDSVTSGEVKRRNPPSVILEDGFR